MRYPSPTRGGPPITAVDAVSLDVAAGEVVALLGASGSGKSSLLRAVAGLEPVAAGDVTWDGESVVSVPVHRRGFGLLFQDGQLFAHRDVAGNVGYGLQARGDRGAGGHSHGTRTDAHPQTRETRETRADRVAELLELVGLPGQERRDPATLSGGERQRVALARALAPRPRLLLLDEPLSALDRALRERLATDLRAALVATGTTAVLVTHDQDEAFAVADRVAVMDAGRLLQVARPGELWRAPASREVAAFLGYEAFVPTSSPAAAPWRAALTLAAVDEAIPPAATKEAAAAVVAADRDRRPDGAGTLAPAAAGGAPAPAAAGGAPASAAATRTLAPAATGETPASAAVGGTLALAAGALVVRPGAEGDVVGTVLAVGARRGRSEVRVDVPGIGPVTALAPPGWTATSGESVALCVDPDSVVLLP